jgi:hypothetical protein
MTSSPLEGQSNTPLLRDNSGHPRDNTTSSWIRTPVVLAVVVGAMPVAKPRMNSGK